MNGTPTDTAARSVQLAVMTTPSTSVAEAVAEARRRPHSSDARAPRRPAGAILVAQPTG
jgi:hypothetical protein